MVGELRVESRSVPETHARQATHPESLVERDERFVATEVDHVRALEQSKHAADQLGTDSAPLELGKYLQERDERAERTVPDGGDEPDHAAGRALAGEDDVVAALEHDEVAFGRRSRRPVREEPGEISRTEALERGLVRDHGRTVAARSATLRLVTDTLAHRLVVLGAVALLAAVSALAFSERLPEEDSSAFTSAPAPAGWNTAFAGSRGPVGDAQRTTCGQVLAAESVGVTHPVLPCGVKVVLRNGETQVLTEVIDNALVEPGRQLEVTETLAGMLGIDGTVEVEWRFATEASS